jgi:hypothetical protein
VCDVAEGEQGRGLACLSAATREDPGRILPSSRADPVGIVDQNRGSARPKSPNFGLSGGVGRRVRLYIATLVRLGGLAGYWSGIREGQNSFTTS